MRPWQLSRTNGSAKQKAERFGPWQIGDKPVIPFPPDVDVRELEYPLRNLLRNFTYRPGWMFSVYDGCLTVHAQVIDANNQTETCPLTSVQQLPMQALHYKDFDWTNWLFRTILDLERHETQEFFRINGQPVYDPHSGDY
jgi:hypothetical protein